MNILRSEGLYSQKTMIRRSSKNLGYKLKKQNVVGKNTGAICALDVKYLNRMFESKDGTTSMKYLIRLKEA